MTLEFDPEEETGPPPEPEPRPRKPAWAAFLLPGAILIGALAIAAAILYVWRDDGDGDTAPATGESTVAPAANEDGLLELFTGYGEDLGLDTEAFQACLRSDMPATLMNQHLQEGIRLGVNGTPTFFINNKMLVGSQPIEVLEEVIDGELSGGRDSIDDYSADVQQLAASGRFQIINGTPSLDGAEYEGDPSARVVVAEFSDFQCPFCQRWTADSLPTLRQRLGSDVALAFLHFPIIQIHPNAGNAGAVAICAGEQGKFWEMHDLLFERQQEWENVR